MNDKLKDRFQVSEQVVLHLQHELSVKENEYTQLEEQTSEKVSTLHVSFPS